MEGWYCDCRIRAGLGRGRGGRKAYLVGVAALAVRVVADVERVEDVHERIGTFHAHSVPRRTEPREPDNVP